MSATAKQTLPALLPTHFRCLAYHCWMPISHCEGSRAIMRARKKVQYQGALQPVHCRACPQAPGVDAGTDPTLTTALDVLNGTTPPVPATPWFANKDGAKWSAIQKENSP